MSGPFLPGYDDWKTRLPPKPICDDPGCTCTTDRMDKWCPVHGKDPDYERDKMIDDYECAHAAVEKRK